MYINTKEEAIAKLTEWHIEALKVAENIKIESIAVNKIAEVNQRYNKQMEFIDLFYLLIVKE